MHLLLRFAVAQAPARVLAGFTRELFLALAPAVPTTRLLRYDGCRVGDWVAVELALGPKRWRWTSLITEAGELPDGTRYFVDEGQELPAPLRRWQHRHRIEPGGPRGGSVIVEDIQFSTGRRWLDWLLYPAVWAQFWRRGPIYRWVFGR